jgi:hypothetical protein
MSGNVWKCLDCPGAFEGKAALRTHVSGEHDGMRMVCVWCTAKETTFRNAGSLRRHVEAKHPQEYPLLPGTFLSEMNASVFAVCPELYRLIVSPPMEGDVVAKMARDKLLRWVEVVPKPTRSRATWLEGWSLTTKQVSPIPDRPTTTQGYSPSKPQPAINPEELALVNVELSPERKAVFFTYQEMLCRIDLKHRAEPAQVAALASVMANICRPRDITPSQFWVSPILGTLGTALQEAVSELVKLNSSQFYKVFKLIERRHRPEKTDSRRSRVRDLPESPLPRPRSSPTYATSRYRSRSPVREAVVHPSPRKTTVASVVMPVEQAKPSPSTRFSSPELGETPRFVLEDVDEVETESERILRTGRMPLVPPAHRRWSTAGQVVIPVKLTSFTWPPTEFAQMTPKDKLRAWDSAATMLKLAQQGPDAVYESTEQGQLLDTYNMLAIPGTKVPQLPKVHDASSSLRKLRHYSYHFLRQSGPSADLSMIHRLLGATETSEETAWLTSLLDRAGIPLNLSEAIDE